jgi:competence protein ComEC
MKKWVSRGILIILALAAISIWYEVVISPDKSGIIVKFCDVGQGDAALIQKDDIQIVIDGGPDDSVLSCIAEEMPAYDKKIDYIILSHPHADHLVGLNSIVSRYELGMVYFNNVKYDSAQYTKFIENINNKNVVVPQVGETIALFEHGQAEFLYPGKKFSGQNSDDLNVTSEVLRFCYYDHCVLFTGDGEAEDGIYQNIDAGGLKSEILKVPHHGSASSIDQNFINAVKPAYAIISVGEDNKYGHPVQSVINLLNENQVDIILLNVDGDAVFTVDESSLSAWRVVK